MKHETLEAIVTAPFAAAVGQVAGREPAAAEARIGPPRDPQAHDYQCNAALALAKSLKAKPRDVAARIVAAVAPLVTEIAEPLEIAGAGYINIRLKREFLARYLGEIPAPPAAALEATGWPPRDRVGLPVVDAPQRVIVEYSQPNIAKQMHVGHLRSTIIGDVFARVLAFEGHEVIRQNHIGDWGTQFGILIRWYREHPVPTPETHPDVLDAIERDYRVANARFKEDELFAAEARRAVAELQSGDPDARRVWEQICAVSWRDFTEIYTRLGVLLQPEDVRGESFYNERLPAVIADLEAKLPVGGAGAPHAEVRVDQGAVCVFMYDERGEPLFKNPDGSILPLIIQKSDSAYLYATTDLAAIRFRVQELGVQRVIYVTDDRQKLHFQMFLTAARLAGWLPPSVRVDHVTYGKVLGADGTPLKTRAGDTPKLRWLLDEAEQAARRLLDTREQGDEEGPRPGLLTESEKQHVARRIGISAVKYFDLARSRNGDYVFDVERLDQTVLALKGNTAPYMMYAYARIRSIYRKAAELFGSPDVYAPGVALRLDEVAERTLALRLARFREAIDAVAAELTPHVLCTYLYDLAADFMRFYESCPVLAASDEATRLSRMRLCDLTARTLKLGLGLLGIEVIERM